MQSRPHQHLIENYTCSLHDIADILALGNTHSLTHSLTQTDITAGDIREMLKEGVRSACTQNMIEMNQDDYGKDIDGESDERRV